MSSNDFLPVRRPVFKQFNKLGMRNARVRVGALRIDFDALEELLLCH